MSPVSECILILDITRDPLELSLVDIGVEKLHLIEHKALPIGNLFTNASTLPQVYSDTTPPTPTTESAGLETTGTGTNGNHNESLSPSNSLTSSLTDSLKNELASLTGRWSSAVVIIPPYNYLSFNIELPFTDSKSINRVLSLEVQDIMPFEVSEFLLQFHTLSQFPDNQYDVHVSMVPKNYIRGVLSILNAVGLEPLIMSTPSSILEALCHLSPNTFSQDSVFLGRFGPWYTIGIRIGGVFRQDRIIHLGMNGTEKTWGMLFHDIQLTIQAAEKRYEKNIEKIYLLDDVSKAEALSSSLNRSVEAISLETFVTSSNGGASLTTLSAVFAREIGAPPILTNFRTGEFAYSPKLKEVLRALRMLLPYFTWVFCATLVTLLVIYLTRENRASRLRSTLDKQINAIIPTLDLRSVTDDQLLPSILAESHRVSQDLMELGSPSKLTPLDALLEISKSFPTVERVKVTKVTIEGNQVTIDGSAPDLAAIDNIRKTLQKNSQFAKVKEEVDSSRNFGGQNEKSYKLVVYLKE